MEPEASNGTNVTSRSKRTNFSWNVSLDALLVGFLQQLALTGQWKVDTDFKIGYLGVLEKMFHKQILGCGIKATPHIQSRVKLLKSQTRAIHKMLTKGSGFTWCDQNKFVNCEKMVYDLWVQSHPTANGLFKKPFMHFDALVDIYANDYANGTKSFLVEDAQAQVIDEQAQTAAAFDPESILGAEFGLDNTFEEMLFADMNSFRGADSDTTCASQVPSPQTAIPASSATPTPSITMTHKRKASSLPELPSSVSEIASAIIPLTEASKDCMKVMASTLAPEVDPTKEVFAALPKMESLSNTEKLAAARVIAREPSHVQMFLMTPEEERDDMIRDILAYDGN